jgi:hypothetical protein
VRRVTPLGAIFTVAGSTAGDAGNGGLAKSGLLNHPASISGAPGGGFLVADTGNATVRRVSAIGAVPPAVVGHSIAIAPTSGKVSVLPLGMSSASTLAQEDLVPTGSQADATSGHIAVTVARSAAGVQQTADVYAGPFTVAQQGSVGQPYTDIGVPDPTGCPVTKKHAVASSAATARAVPTATTARKKKKKKRRVWVSKHGGHWKTTSGSSSSSGIGTKWLTETYCDGTRIAVQTGIVKVRDKVRHKTIRLTAGQAYQTHLHK